MDRERKVELVPVLLRITAEPECATEEPYERFNALASYALIESDDFCASGLVVMGFLLWEEGSGKQDLRVVER